MKRFYKMVTTAQNAAGGFEIHLDGKPVKTPSGAVLLVKTTALAEQVALEWAAQGEAINPDSMPLTQLCVTAQDRVAAERAVMSAQVLAYLDTDLLCYRAAEPEVLAEKQRAAWDPHLAWFAQTYGAPLAVTESLQALRQPQAAHASVAASVAAHDDLQFTILQLVTALSGSLVLALAFVAGKIEPEQLFDAIHVEESYKATLYNEELYGAAPHEEKKRAALRAELAAARKFLDLLQD